MWWEVYIFEEVVLAMFILIYCLFEFKYILQQSTVPVTHLQSKVVLNFMSEDISFDRAALPGEIYSAIQWVFTRTYLLYSILVASLAGRITLINQEKTELIAAHLGLASELMSMGPLTKERNWKSAIWKNFKREMITFNGASI